VTADEIPARCTRLYAVDELPVFQNRMFQSAAQARKCVRGNVQLVQDRATGLIFNQAFQPDLMQYDSHYQTEQALSSVFRRHLQAVAAVIARHFSKRSVIEVGCGKGHFLEQLQQDGFEVIGLDPTYEGSNPAVIKQYFSPEIGLQADSVILRHVLEHVPDPVAFLGNIRDANGGKGRIYIEVPCFDWICEQRAWFDIFYEHVNYFRLSDLQQMFGTVHESGHLFAGQYLFVVADLASVRQPSIARSGACGFPQDFLDTVSQHAGKLRERAAGSSAIWGGASKGVMFALFMHRAGVNIDVVVDINPAKHGKYIPATGLRIRSPEEAMKLLSPGADIFVMNGNYLQEIAALTRNQFNYVRVDHESI
jgi:SAM-dependent methyltransferase